jgi:hypothetical protein
VDDFLATILPIADNDQNVSLISLHPQGTDVVMITVIVATAADLRPQFGAIWENPFAQARLGKASGNDAGLG